MKKHNAIDKLKKAGFGHVEIARKIGASRHSVRLWQRAGRTPNGEHMRKLIALAESKGITLFASDFT